MTRILIADDQAIVRHGLRKIVESHGCEVVAEASNGKEAISKAIETKPDIAILEYALPLLNGIEATRQIRARLPSIEILMLTTHAADEVIEECLRAGARGYLLKSTTDSELLSAIEFLAVHKPFLTGKVAENLLNSFLASPTSRAAAIRFPSGARKVLPALQRSVLQLAGEGHTSQQIAERLNMNVKLVDTLMDYAIRNGLIKR